MSQSLRLPIRHLGTGDTLLTFANCSVAQHPFDPLGIGVETTGRPSHWQSGGQPELPRGPGR